LQDQDRSGAFRAEVALGLDCVFSMVATIRRPSIDVIAATAVAGGGAEIRFMTNPSG
jgi:hypothetical protein